MVTRQEVIDKIRNLVTIKYDGDYKKAFDAEDKDKDGEINYDELEQILKDANIKVRLTRWAIAQEIIKALDPNSDGYIAWNEFQAVLK